MLLLMGMDTKQTVTVAVKDVYGNKLNYPVCDRAKLLAALLSRKTLTTRDLSYAKALGFGVIYVCTECATGECKSHN